MSKHLGWEGYGKGSPQYARIIFALFLAGFATFAQIFDAQAILPALSSDLGIGAASAALTVSASTVGLAVSVLPWASVADRIGRTQAMKISLLSATILAAVTPLMPAFELVIVCRALTGVALGAVPGVSMAYLAEELSKKWVSVAAGTFVAGNTVGGIVGRLVAGTLSDLAGWRTGLLVISLISLVLTCIFWLVVPQPRGFTPNQPQPLSWAFRVRSQLRDPVMLTLYAQGLLLMGSFTVVYNFLGYRLIAEPFSLPPFLVSLLFVAYFAGTVSSRISGSLTGRFGHLRVMLAGMSAMVLGALLLLSSDVLTTVIGLVIFTIGCFCSHPVASGLTGQVAQVGRSQATALYQLSWLAGTALFGAVGGIIFDTSGWSRALGLVFVLVALSALIAVIGLTWGKHHRPRIEG